MTSNQTLMWLSREPSSDEGSGACICLKWYTEDGVWRRTVLQCTLDPERVTLAELRSTVVGCEPWSRCLWLYASDHDTWLATQEHLDAVIASYVMPHPTPCMPPLRLEVVYVAEDEACDDEDEEGDYDEAMGVLPWTGQQGYAPEGYAPDWLVGPGSGMERHVVWATEEEVLWPGMAPAFIATHPAAFAPDGGTALGATPPVAMTPLMSDPFAQVWEPIQSASCAATVVCADHSMPAPPLHMGPFHEQAQPDCPGASSMAASLDMDGSALLEARGPLAVPTVKPMASWTPWPNVGVMPPNDLPSRTTTTWDSCIMRM